MRRPSSSSSAGESEGPVSRIVERNREPVRVSGTALAWASLHHYLDAGLKGDRICNFYVQARWLIDENFVRVEALQETPEPLVDGIAIRWDQARVPAAPDARDPLNDPETYVHP